MTFENLREELEKRVKGFVQIFGCSCFLMFTACGPAVEMPSEYYMTYKLNGVPMTLNDVGLITETEHPRYSIAGVDDTDKDAKVLIIGNQQGPLANGKFTSQDDDLIFQLGKLNAGFGTYEVSTITDTYVKGTFSFRLPYRGDQGEKNNYMITDGRFKAQILEPLGDK